MRHVGDEEENCEILRMSREEREAYNLPFDQWRDINVDEGFRDLMGGSMDLDPGRRISAREALGHEWFEGLELFARSPMIVNEVGWYTLSAPDMVWEK